IIEQSLEHRIGVQTMTERFPNLMVIPTMGMSVVAYQLAGTSAMLAVLNADYDTGIRFSGPIAMLSSLSAACKNGILIKNARVLAVIHDVDVMIFEKTGTLIVDVARVANIVAYTSAFDAVQIIRLAAVAERRLAHPIARAILARAAAMEVTLP